jgi:hypothetical protein
MARERPAKNREILMGFPKIRDKFFPVVRDQANIEKHLARYRNIEVFLHTLQHFWWPRKCLYIHG